jgi:hypothetical protein
MRSGIHTWSIEIVKECELTCVGVASTGPSENECQIKRDSWLGEAENGWAYASIGAACHAYGANKKAPVTLPPLKTGTVITLTLDLTKRGCLSVSLAKHEETFQLFENMLWNGEERVDRSFAPAASLRAPGEVRFLGFQELLPGLPCE